MGGGWGADGPSQHGRSTDPTERVCVCRARRDRALDLRYVVTPAKLDQQCWRYQRRDDVGIRSGGPLPLAGAEPDEPIQRLRPPLTPRARPDAHGRRRALHDIPEPDRPVELERHGDPVACGKHLLRGHPGMVHSSSRCCTVRQP